MIERIKNLSEKYFPRVIELRRQIHANPELSWEEYETSKLVAAELNKLPGMLVTTGVAKTGVVGILKGNNPESKCIALRADMDALPIAEQNSLEYCSKKEGKMHACGHDVHTSNLLGVAMILSELKNEIEGTVKFIFQPSEEKIPSGAEAMINAGVLENPKPAKIFGLHVSPELEAGFVDRQPLFNTGLNPFCGAACLSAFHGFPFFALVFVLGCDVKLTRQPLPQCFVQAGVV